MSSVLPKNARGLGLRREHYEAIQKDRPSLGYFEIISENFLEQAVDPMRQLHRIGADYPVVLHGVGLNLLGYEELDRDYLRKLKALADHCKAPFVSDHLCWSRSEGQAHHDLLPMPYRQEWIGPIAERIRQVQDFLERPFGVENLSSYMLFPDSDLSEWDFYRSVVEEAGAHYMLDINNIYVSSENQGFDPCRYLDAIDFQRVLQVHIAGHERQENGLIIDTHGAAVADEVWKLYQTAWINKGPFPTLLEWDEAIPPLDRVLQELARCGEFQDEA